MKYLAIILLVGVLFMPTTAAATTCTFVLGFAAIHDLIPATVGSCLVDEHHNPNNGDGLQETTGPTGAGGLLVWRKSDNWTAYTDGYHTWVNGPNGLQERLNTERFPFEHDPVVTPAPLVSATATPAPIYDYYVETSSYPNQIRAGGSETFCARLSAVGGPPVFNLPARIHAYGHDYYGTTLSPDGNACVTVVVPLDQHGCYVDGFITYNGVELTGRSGSHREYCKILPY